MSIQYATEKTMPISAQYWLTAIIRMTVTASPICGRKRFRLSGICRTQFAKATIKISSMGCV